MTATAAIITHKERIDRLEHEIAVKRDQIWVLEQEEKYGSR